ncbi:MAG: hypothetical protein D6803_03325 [Anaerolineae bacterium]|nr:MAG: hypothetical protein D6803_03325 [Anaerolineae bacterium]
MNPTILLLTDFGTQDPYVGIMKGVIRTLAPQAALVDLTHAIPPGDIRRAALVLWQSLPYFPKGTVCLTVVDPGVGTSRKAMIARSNGYLFVGPDNGVFSFVLGDDAQAWELTNPELALPSTSNTFHGRDLFSPAAAHAARGVPPERFGPPILQPTFLPPPRLDSRAPGQIRAEILHADRFGNLLTSLGRFAREAFGRWRFSPWIGELAPQELDLHATRLALPDGNTLRWVNTFGEIPPGQCAALVGSTGLVELVANRRSAAEILGLQGGETIILHLNTD